MQAANSEVSKSDAIYCQLYRLNLETLYKVDMWIIMRGDDVALRLIVTLIYHFTQVECCLMVSFLL